MARGYWIAHVDVADLQAYRAYVAANAEPIAKHGGRFLARGGRCEMPEGASRQRNVVVEFPDYEAALACYRSPLYQAAIKLREGVSVMDLTIVEGYDGPQPEAQA